MSSIAMAEAPERGPEEGALAEPLQNAVQAKTWAQALVQRLSPLRVRVAVAVVWALLALAGLAMFGRFQAALESEVPPCAGTPSALAKDTFNKYFPATPLSGAFLTKSRDGNKLIDFVKTSTCQIAFTEPLLPPDVKNKTDLVSIYCNATESALGGGCLLSEDIEPQLEKIFMKLGRQWLPFIDKNNETKVNETLLAMQMYLRSHTAAAMKSLPSVTLCPVATPLTKEWFDFTGTLKGQLDKQFPLYDFTELSLSAVPSMKINKSLPLPPNMTAKLYNKSSGMFDIKVINISISVPSGQLWQLLSPRLLTSSLNTALASFQISDPHTKEMILPMSPKAKAVGLYMDELATTAPETLNVKSSSMGVMFYYIKKGISKTMDMSAKTVPLALLILAGMVRNLRLLLIVLPNLIISIAVAILFMYPITQVVTTATVAPSLMIAVDLAMSIDYSLFLLTRFGKEIAAGRDPPEAVAIMLSTSGRIVLVSGFTLMLCFLMMLALPVSFIYSMGIAAAITVFAAVSVALTLVPVILLSCPGFFSNSRNFGISADGCCCGGSARTPPFADEEALPTSTSRDDQDALAENQEAATIRDSCWPSFGSKVQKGAWAVAIALVAIAVPVAITSLPHFQHSVGIMPMMPTDAPSTSTLLELQNAFGVGAIFPTQFIVVAPEGATSNSSKLGNWLTSVCEELERIAADVNAKIDHSTQPPFTNQSFSGAMILNGQCQNGGFGPSFGKWNTIGDPHSATLVSISYSVDPFSPQGLAWVQSLRDAIETPSAKQVASWYVDGTGPIQMDASALTFARLPLMVALMMGVVFVVIAVAFGSIVAPLRAVFCLMWMLVITYGLAIYTFQNGLFDFLDWSPLGQRESGAMSWLSPAMAGAMMVGLGLDYDIFYSERVVEEWEHGYSEKEAAARALGATANTITAAGVIMVVAFLALMVSTTPVLNEIAFLLIISVIIDCFITTKVIIPCAMALLGKWNFWPRKQPVLPSEHQVSLPVSTNTPFSESH